MKESNLSFAGGFTAQNSVPKEQKDKYKTFDWIKAGEIINERLKNYPNLTAEAGLQGDWDYTGGTIFAKGKPVTDSYTYLCSNWATPMLMLSLDGYQNEEIECYRTDDKYNSDSKWDEESLTVLNSKLTQ